jgi:hypothetical protein
MPQVSVADVENLEEAIGNIATSNEAMSAVAQELLHRLAVVADDVNDEVANSSAMLASAVQEEMARQSELAAAHIALAAAQAELASAYARLGACEAQGPDEHGHPPNCSSEASAVASAGASVAAATAAVTQATQAYESAKEHRMLMEQRNEIAQRAASQTAQLEEVVRTECAVRLHACQGHEEQAHKRLSEAKSALDAYLATSPPAAQFVGWLNWRPNKTAVIGPSEIGSRVNLSPEQQRLFLTYLTARDPMFSAKVAGYRKEFRECQGAAELHALQLKVRRNLAGDFAERLALQALQPLAEKATCQARTVFADGRYTKTDLLLENLRAPVILGRGEGMAAPAGKSIAVELKCGQARYLFDEKDHMVYQAAGHRAAAASMTICSKDVHDLSAQEEDELRSALREAGSPLIGMLPRKEDIDKACWDAVVQGEETSGGDT